MRVPALVKRPVFGPHGRGVVAFLCSWELVAFLPGSPLPTLSQVVKRHPMFGAVLLGLLGHHWYVESEG